MLPPETIQVQSPDKRQYPDEVGPGIVEQDEEHNCTDADGIILILHAGSFQFQVAILSMATV
jgi:hypothetical protein